MNPVVATLIIGVLSAAVLGLSVALYRVLRRDREAITSLAAAREEIDREEHRMFAFLHALGEALAKYESSSRMYEIIVSGVADVINADGGGLYLIDRRSGDLVPTYFTRKCPPFVPLPADVTESARTNPKSVGSYLRLASVAPGVGVLGRSVAENRAVRVTDLSKESNGSGTYDTPFHHGLSVMVAPLRHGETNVGALAVANGRDRRPFDEHAFDLFKSVAEQSGFALGNALARREAADKRRIEDELKAASEIQRILLPEGSPSLRDYRVAGENYPAKIVSGDYYDFVEIDRSHYGVVIADVSGKGIPASLIMAMCRSVLRANAPDNHSPSSVLAAVNRHLFPDIREDMFISMAYLILNKASNEVVMARAGQDPPMLFLSREKRVTTLNPPGMALGIDSGAVFDRVTRDFSFTMEPSDVLLLYTDGINEALDAKGEEFGIDRLREAFSAAATHGADAVISAVMSSVREFVGESRQSDDITLIAIEKR